MLDLKQYYEFEKNFIQYLKNGKYPSKLDNIEDLKIFIKTQLSQEQRAQLRMAIFQNVALIDNWQLIGPVCESFARSIPQGILGGIATGLATYKATDDLTTSLRNGCATGLLWIFGRTSYANHSIKSYYAKSKERQSVFSDVLPTHVEANEIISSALRRERSKLSSPIVNAQRSQTLAEKIKTKQIRN